MCGCRLLHLLFLKRRITLLLRLRLLFIDWKEPAAPFAIFTNLLQLEKDDVFIIVLHVGELESNLLARCLLADLDPSDAVPVVEERLKAEYGSCLIDRQ